MRELNGKLPHVSIIILTYNQKENTIECLESFENVKYSNMSITLVDNGSSDAVSDLVKTKFPLVKIIRSEINRGCGGGRNFGAKGAIERNDSGYLLFLDNDTVVDAYFIDYLVKTAEEVPFAGIVSAKLLNYYQRNIVDGIGNKINLFTGKCPKIGYGEIDKGQYDSVLELDAASGCCQLISVDLWRRLKGYDEAFNPYGYEDLDMCLRVKNIGLKILFSKNAIIFHKGTQTLGKGGYVSSYTKVKGKLMKRFLCKHAKFHHWIGFAAIAPFLALGTIVRAFRGGDPAASINMFLSFFYNKK
jgi:GT2 family glycosyltransferase